MATHTIYGCVLSDGTLEFVDDESGCEDATITACVIDNTADANYGKVKVTHSGCQEDVCACVDDATGKFVAEIDDECCDDGGSWVPGSCCGWEGTVQPEFIKLTFSGMGAGMGSVEDCGWYNGKSWICSVDSSTQKPWTTYPGPCEYWDEYYGDPLSLCVDQYSWVRILPTYSSCDVYCSGSYPGERAWFVCVGNCGNWPAFIGRTACLGRAGTGLCDVFPVTIPSCAENTQMCTGGQCEAEVV